MTNQPPEQPRNRLPRPRRRQFPAPLTEPLSADATPADDLEPEYDDYDDYEPGQESLLRNPYVLAAIAVVGAIFLAVVVVIFAGGGGDGGAGGAVSTPDPLTPSAGVGVESIATSTVREGPSAEYFEVGTLPRGQKVVVTGRNAESTWFQIVFPANSTLRGWVAASALKVADLNVPSLAVVQVTPIARPTIVQPTLAPEATETPEATVTTTASATPGPDIAVTIAGSNCAVGSALVVVVGNLGTTPVTNRTLTVAVSVGGTTVSTQAIPIASLAPGETVTIPTAQTVQAPRTSVTVDLQGSPADINKGNNTDQCVLQGGAATPTPVGSAPTPTRTPTPIPTTVSP